jgi:hypothetical protein
MRLKDKLHITEEINLAKFLAAKSEGSTPKMLKPMIRQIPEQIPHHHNHRSSAKMNHVIFPSTSRSSKWSFSRNLFSKILHALLVSQS